MNIKHPSVTRLRVEGDNCARLRAWHEGKSFREKVDLISLCLMNDIFVLWLVRTTSLEESDLVRC